MAGEFSVTAQALSELIDQLSSTADKASRSDLPAVETCLQLFEKLKHSKVNTQLLVETQGGKKVRKLTKHVDVSVKAAAIELVSLWKGVVANEAGAIEQSKEELGHLQPADAPAPHVPNSRDATAAEDRPMKRNREESEAVPSLSPLVKKAAIPPKPLVVPKLGDAARDKIRLQLAEALQLAAADVPEGDPGQCAADIEAAVLKQNGAANPKYKAKIRSIWVNLKDPKNPDFRRSVLLGDISGEDAVSLKPEEMASKARQEENQRIRDAAMFEAERGKKRLATTDQFQCGRCKKRQTSYYQMQTRSADEPMTTFVICQVCDNRWKFC